MTATAPKATRPDDEQLATLQFRISDPAAMPDYSRSKPDPSLEPTIIGQYDLRPEGGRTRLREEPFFWCCHCQKDNHWLGFGITNETGKSYSIGKDCAAAHYGVAFTRIRRNFFELSNRQGVLARLDRIAAAAEGVENGIAAILRCGSLGEIDAKRIEITKAHENAGFLLSAAANSGSAMTEEIQVRDLAAERNRAERLGDRDPGTPIMRSERNALGPMEGRAVMRTQSDCRDRLIALRAALKRTVAARQADTNTATTSELTKIVRTVEEEHARAMESIASYRRAANFFSDRNIDRIARWSASHRDFRIVPTAEGFEIRPAGRDGVRITRLRPVSVPDLPAIDGSAPLTDASRQPQPSYGEAVVPQTEAADVRSSGAWPPERVAQLRTLWEAGATAAEIGKALGGVSRNAVIGKAKRLGLPFR